MPSLILDTLATLPEWMAARPRFAWAFFDIDGTLCRPEAIGHLFSDVASSQGVAVSSAELCAWLGRARIQDPDELLRTVLAGKGCGRAMAVRLVAAYVQAFGRLPRDYFTPFLYPDVVPALARLRSLGIGIGIVTNRFEAQAWAQMRATAVGEMLAHHSAYGMSEQRVLCGGDSPAPPGDWRTAKGAQLALHLARLGISPGAALMVGDVLEADVAGAKEAGMTACWLRRGVVLTA